jgi:pilus assembly protein CpaF
MLEPYGIDDRHGRLHASTEDGARDRGRVLIDVIIQAARLRDGSRRITQITEVLGMEGDVIITQDLVRYDIEGEDANGKLIGEHVSTGVGRPRFWERARYYNEEQRLATALESMEKRRD